MTALPLSPFSYSLADYGLPSLRLTNMYVGATPAGPGEDGRFRRPGLVQYQALGNGPVWGLFRQEGTFNGDQFAVVGDGFFRNEVRVSTVVSTRRARFAASVTQVVVASGGKVYLYDGIPQTTPIYGPPPLKTIPIPDGQMVSDVAYLNGRFYYQIDGSGKFYWSEINDAVTIDGLSFATAESSPDSTLALENVGEELWFFGQESTEPWRGTANIDLPISKSSGRTRQGCAAQLAVVPFDTSVLWVTDTRIVTAPSGRVSNHSVEARLSACSNIADASAFRADIDGHPFYVLNIPGQISTAYDLATQQWADWTSYGRSDFRCHNSISHLGYTYLGDDTSGIIWRLDRTSARDGTDAIEVIASVAIPVLSPLTLSNLSLKCAVGVGLSSGDADEMNPTVEMRMSPDLTRTWYDWDQASLGVQGDYSNRATWFNLGLLKEPVCVVEFRSTSPVVRSFGTASYNDPHP